MGSIYVNKNVGRIEGMEKNTELTWHAGFGLEFWFWLSGFGSFQKQAGAGCLTRMILGVVGMYSV